MSLENSFAKFAEASNTQAIYRARNGKGDLTILADRCHTLHNLLQCIGLRAHSQLKIRQ